MVNGGEWITHVERVSGLVSSKCSKLLSPKHGTCVSFVGSGCGDCLLAVINEVKAVCK